MPYNPLHKLNDNIAAIRIALEGKTPSQQEMDMLRSYSGFGGIKAILYPHGPKDEWKKSGATKEDFRLYDKIQSLHELLKEKFDDSAYKQVVDSIKSSVLTAFYAPPVIPQTIYKALQEQGIEVSRLYEPSAGAGIFITEAVSVFKNLKHVTAVEKDILTGKVLQVIIKGLNVESNVHSIGLEHTPDYDNGKYDLIVSNIPFGNFKVYDNNYPLDNITGKVHNYFFAKGIDKLGDGGILAFITTDAFLNGSANKGAREYLFKKADFISLSVMPDNLMKETGNTEAPNHLLIVQKNESKVVLSYDEKLLLETIGQENEFGRYHLNQYIHQHPGIVCANEVKAGTNQYGRAHQAIWQTGDINGIAQKLSATISEGLATRFNLKRYRHLQSVISDTLVRTGKKLTFLEMPDNKPDSDGLQLGLFDTAPVQNINRAMAYVTNNDIASVQRQTARIVATVRTTERPEHESIVLLTARSKYSPFYIYKLQSNLGEIKVAGNWMNAATLGNTIERVSSELKEYSYDFRFEGDRNFEAAFGVSVKEEFLTGLKPHYKEGTLVVYQGAAGTLHNLDKDHDQAEFKAFSLSGKTIAFYQQYSLVRDIYFTLIDKENASAVEHKPLREELNTSYQYFQSQYGLLNQPSNRKYILDDSLGFITLSSLERKEGEQYVKADIFYQPLFKKQEGFSTDDPVEALAHCLNEKGSVNIDFIAKNNR
ncbi:MAG: hypothetical protein ABI675_14385 [Chitinophagaceae bacterium]